MRLKMLKCDVIKDVKKICLLSENDQKMIICGQSWFDHKLLASDCAHTGRRLDFSKILDFLDLPSRHLHSPL